MKISPGSKLPEAMLQRLGPEGVEQVPLGEKLAGRKVVLFGLPGAFTGTCSTAHVPSFMRTRDQFAAKGVDEIICISVNDPWVMDAWDKATGAGSAGVTMLADGSGDFTASIGMTMNVPAIGFIGRSKRYSALVDDGVVTILNTGDVSGSCEISAGETLLDAM